MSVSICEKLYPPFGKVLVLENELAELAVTLDFGPHIIRFARRGVENLFFEDREAANVNCGPVYDKYYKKGAYWRNYGGHRVWLSPESEPRTYYPVNDPVSYAVNGNTVTFIPPEQVENGVQLTLTVTLEENDSVAQISSAAVNTSDLPQTFGIWNITVMRAGGLGLMPLNTRPSGLLHNRTMSFWSYTDMADPRVTWGRELVSVAQDPASDHPFKIGVPAERGWLAYLRNGDLFVKRFPFFPDTPYPDGGCSAELYTNPAILELESLGRLAPVSPGDCITSSELWSITPGVPAVPAGDMAALEKLVADYIEE